MNKVEVALVKRLCPICLKESDGEIIMNQVLTEKRAREVKEMHGKVVGYLEQPCDSCIEKLGEDKIAIIPLDIDDSATLDFVTTVEKRFDQNAYIVQKSLLGDDSIGGYFSFTNKEFLEKVETL